MISKIIISLAMCILLLGQGYPCFGETYYNFYEYGGTWNDVNKTWVDDYYMCWAAATANVLSWGRWGTAEYRTAPQIFEKFKFHWPDSANTFQNGVRWWFRGGFDAVLDVPGGGNYWPGYDPYVYYYSETWLSWTPPNLNSLGSYLRDGYGVSISLHSYSRSHAVTCWGYDYDPRFSETDSRYYTRLYLTDSDDYEVGLFNYPISQNSEGRWVLSEGPYTDLFISGFSALQGNSIFFTNPPGYFMVGKEAMRGFYDLMLYLSFDYKWELPIPSPGDPCSFLVQILTEDGWLTIFQDELEQDEIGWKSVNIPIDQNMLGLQELRFLVEGDAQVCLYRLNPVPLPSAVWLLASGLLGLVGWQRSRKS